LCKSSVTYSGLSEIPVEREHEMGLLIVRRIDQMASVIVAGVS